MSENGKPAKYFAEIKTTTAMTKDNLDWWRCVTEGCETATKARQALRSVAPKEAFSWRIIKVAESGRSKIETSVKLTSV